MVRPELPAGSSICILPDHKGIGGPASFRSRIISGLESLDIHVHSDPLRKGTHAILVIGGTRRLDLLWRARQQGTRIVQRLNGMNWVHRKTRTGLPHFVRSEINNWILATIRRSLANEIIYQSRFTRDWWNGIYGALKVPESVVYNGADLNLYSPYGREHPPSDRYWILVIEGHFEGGYHIGLENAVDLAKSMQLITNKRIELMVVGDVPMQLRKRYSGLEWIAWKGVVSREQIPSLCRSSHLLFSADINAACPNSVIEALACGLPVISYDTGALKEMVGEQAGAIMPYGADYTNLDPARPDKLADAGLTILEKSSGIRKNARRLAEEKFDVWQMVTSYLQILIGNGK